MLILLGSMTKKNSDFIHDIPPNTKVIWTCSKYNECKFCPYFYYSCHGLSNPRDPRVRDIPEDLERYITMGWNTNNVIHNHYIYWMRIRKYLGITFEKPPNLSVEEIEKMIQDKLGTEPVSEESKEDQYKCQINSAYLVIEDLIGQFCYGDGEKEKFNHSFLSASEHAWAYIKKYHPEIYQKKYKDLPSLELKGYES